LTEHHKKDVKTKVIGIRPGEKIHEILVNETEARRTHQLDNCYVIKSDIEKHQTGITATYLQGAPAIECSELSSKDFLISPEQLYQALLENNIL